MFLPQEGAVAAMLKGDVALASKDIDAIILMLIDAAMKMFHDLRMPVVFMQNVITDLLLGLRINDCFRIFPSRKAIAYVCSQPRIESIVFGVSARANIRQTTQLIEELSTPFQPVGGVSGPTP